MTKDEDDPRLNRKTIDKRVKELVMVLQIIPGIITVASCGGHKKAGNRLNPAQENTFYVEFICKGNTSDTTIPLIQRATRKYAKDITISRWLEMEEKVNTKIKGTVWNITGENIHPVIIAMAIFKEWKKNIKVK
jgi:hypothetical protein